MHPRARGRGVQVQKFFSQITIVLRDSSKEVEAAEAA
jgi:ribosomal protein L22